MSVGSYRHHSTYTTLAIILICGHSHITSHKEGGGRGLLINVTKSVKGWVDCFWSVMSHV